MLKFLNPYVCIFAAVVAVVVFVGGPADVEDGPVIQSMTPPVGDTRPWVERDPRAFAAYLRAEESRVNQARHGGR